MQVTESPKLLVSAKDPASAYSVIPLIQQLILDARFDFHIVAEPPASRIFKDHLDLRSFKYSEISPCKNVESLNLIASNLISEIKPDLVLTGISGPDYGIDEAIITKFSLNRKNSSYSLQSYWGDININSDTFANTFFVLDDFAARVTKNKIQTRCIVTGSPRYDNYHNIDHLQLKNDYRLSLLDQRKAKIIGFYGQPLDNVPGYKETLLDFSVALKALPQDCLLIYRPHPKECQRQREWTFNTLASSGLAIEFDDELDVEYGLCGCDLVISAFSSCGYDAQQLNLRSRQPLGVSVYLMFNSQLVNWYESYSGFSDIPMCSNYMAVQITDKAKLSTQIIESLTSLFNEKSWHSIKDNFPIFGNASCKIIDILYQDWINLNTHNA
jgi:hypothetical protein